MTRHHPDHEVELYKEDDEYTVVVDVSDYARENVTVRWHDGRLVVTAEDHEDGGRASVFNRTVSLPHPVVADDISATHEGGVLEVHLPIESDEHHVGSTIEVSE